MSEVTEGSWVVARLGLREVSQQLDSYLHQPVQSPLRIVDVARDRRLLNPRLEEFGVWTQAHLVLETVKDGADFLFENARLGRKLNHSSTVLFSLPSPNLWCWLKNIDQVMRNGV